MNVPENNKGPRNRGYWLSPAEIAQQLPASTNGSICYELGASGSIHAGSLRAFYFAEQVQRAVAMAGKNIRYILRLNDLAPAKVDDGSKAAGGTAGARIAGEIYRNDGQTLLDRLKEEVQIVYARTGWKPPQLIMVSEIYKSELFIERLEAVLFWESEIVEKLSKYKQSPVSIHYPICPRCRRVRSSAPMVHGCEKNKWECIACHAKFEFFPGRSLGLVTFKLEQALIWQFCSTLVDVHGQDHVEAFDASCELVRAFDLGSIPLAGRLNLVFDQLGAKLSKSKKNFMPVVDLSTGDLQELISTYERTAYWRPIGRKEVR